MRPDLARSIGRSAWRVIRKAAVRFVEGGREVVPADAGVVDQRQHGGAKALLQRGEELLRSLWIGDVALQLHGLAAVAHDR